MKIGITGPISTESVADHLEGDISSLPKGMGGAPLLGTMISALIDRGHEVSAYTLDRSLPPSLSQPIVAHGNGFKIYYGAYRQHSFRPNSGRQGRMLDLFRTERQTIEQVIRIDKPDVVHAHWTYEFALAAIASGIPHVVTCHDSPIQVLKFTPNLYRLGRYLMARLVFNRAEAISAVSPYLKNEIARYARVPVAVIPNPTPPILLNRQLSSAARTSNLSQPRIAMILNGWDRRKNPVPALKAFAMLRQTVPGATLHLFGRDFGTGERGQLWAQSNRSEQGMVFHGSTPHEQLLTELDTMHLLLHPALEECCPMALIEAMALGLPVVGGDKSGGVPWVLDYGSTGMLADVRSAESLCRAMLEIIGKNELYERISRDGVERAHTVFSPAVVAEEYEKMYKIALLKQS
jgi:L-malate glycosyltransferase